MMATLKIKPKNYSIKKQNNNNSLTSYDKDIIQNVYGNDSEIPQTIYNRVQNNLNTGKKTNVILKLELADGNTYWTKNQFNPSISNQSKNNFTVKTELSSQKEIFETKKLYSKLSKIEQSCDTRMADKFLEGYLEEKCISFNDLVYL